MGHSNLTLFFNFHRSFIFLSCTLKDLFGNAKERKSFIRKVVDTRNYFTHYDIGLENQALSGKKLGDLEKLDRLHLKLKALLQLHFLKLIGMDIKSIKSIANENYAFRNKLGRE